MLLRAIVSTTSLLMLAAMTVAAGTPWGGDDNGWIPPDTPKGPITKCETGVAKSVAKFVGGITKCHAGRVSGKYADAAAEETCEAAAKAKLELTKTTGCEACTDLASAASDWEYNFDQYMNPLLYCGNGSSSFGGDDLGYIPSDAPSGPVTKCENKVGKALAKAVGDMVKCHIGRASGKYGDALSEDACEAAAVTKFGLTKTMGCDLSCTDLSTLATFAEDGVDFAIVPIYCASPSGAFLD
jgi:hypothetical protein